MSILIVRQDDKIEEWKNALVSADANLEVYSYLEPHPKHNIKMALLWKQPPHSLLGYEHLQCIASAGAGVDFILEDHTLPTDIPITRLVDEYLAKDMSEHVLSVILAQLKNLYDYRVEQFEKKWLPRPYSRISDKTVGIMGLGALGKQLAEDLVSFGFKVQGWSASRKEMTQVNTFAGDQELPEFLKTTEVLVCLLPLTRKTRGILDKDLFQQLPKGAYVINVARGGHLVDEDLITNLDCGHLAGAALDVYHEEPLPKSHPFWQHSQIHMTPHCASVSDTRSVIPQILENYARLLTHRPLINEVSREQGY